ncbi:amidohydrolase family protein [Chloroflexota bacterium]
MIIDFHTHVFPPRIKQKRSEYIAADPCFALLYSQKKARLATADELIASMDKEGIEISVIANIGWATHELCVETNDYILEAVTRYPDRLVGFGAVQPLAGEAAGEEVERLAREGIKGIGELRPDVQFLDVGDSRIMTPFIEVIQKHRLMLLVHASDPIGHDYPGKGGITPTVLYSLITGYPNVTLVCAHWGGGLPFYALMPEVKQAMKNVYFDSAASPFLYSPQVYRQVTGLVGSEQVLFGSDWPLLEPGRLLKEIDSLNLAPETKELILAGNARRLLGIKAD